MIVDVAAESYGPKVSLRTVLRLCDKLLMSKLMPILNAIRCVLDPRLI